MPKYKLWFFISVVVALLALGGAWLYNSGSYEIYTPQTIADTSPAPKTAPPPVVPKTTEQPQLTPSVATAPEALAIQNNSQAPVIPPVVPATAPVKTTLEQTPQTPLGLSLQARASFFAERFGTYSSARPYENIPSLKEYVTLTFWDYLTQKMGVAKPILPATGYVTKVVGTQVVSIDEKNGVAQINVPMIRQSFTGDNYEVGKIASMLVIFKKINNIWLIDSAYWN